MADEGSTIMGEGLLVILGLALLALPYIGFGLSIAALVKCRRMAAQISQLEHTLRWALQQARVQQPPQQAESDVPSAAPAAVQQPAAPASQPGKGPPAAPLPPERAQDPAGVVRGSRAERAAELPPVLPLPSVPPGAVQVKPAASWESWEEKFGKKLMTWAGVVILFFAAAFFVKFAFDNRWLGPVARISLGLIAGAALLAAGDQCLRRRMRPLGQGLLGGGLAVLYVSLFAAQAIYQLLSQEMTFAAMIAVTIAGAMLAILHNGLPIAFIAVLGGFLTPVLVSTGTDARDALFTYLVLLDLGVLGVAVFKRWRALDALAFIGTAALYTGWYNRFYEQAALVPAMLWLGAFFAVFLILPFTYQLRRQVEAGIERFVLAVANATFAFAYAYILLNDEHQLLLGFVALFLAAVYAAMGALLRRRVPADARALFGFIALAVMFLTMAVPLQLDADGITLAWALEAPVLLFLGYRFRYRPVRMGSIAVLALAVIRVFSEQWPLHAALFTPIFNARFAAAMSAPLAGAVCVFIHRRFKRERTVPDRWIALAAGLGAGLMALLLLHGETGTWFEQRFNMEVIAAEEQGENAPATWTTMNASRRAAQTAIWAVGGAVFLAMGLFAGIPAATVVGLLPLVWAAGLVFNLYGHLAAQPFWLFANGRFAVSALLIAILAAAARSHSRGPGPPHNAARSLAPAFYVAALAGSFLLLSAEVPAWIRAHFHDADQVGWLASVALSIVWGIYAMGLLLSGFAFNRKHLRIAALALFAMSAAKLLLFDITYRRAEYRILSFLAVGLLMISASYLYHRIERRMLNQPEDDNQ